VEKGIAEKGIAAIEKAPTVADKKKAEALKKKEDAAAAKKVVTEKKEPAEKKEKKVDAAKKEPAEKKEPKDTKERDAYSIVVDEARAPKREGTKAFARFAAYRSAKTVGNYIKQNGKRGDISFDIYHKRISLTD